MCSPRPEADGRDEVTSSRSQRLRMALAVTMPGGKIDAGKNRHRCELTRNATDEEPTGKCRENRNQGRENGQTDIIPRITPAKNQTQCPVAQCSENDVREENAESRAKRAESKDEKHVAKERDHACDRRIHQV